MGNGEGGWTLKFSQAGRATNDRNRERKTYAAVAVGRAGLGSPAVSLVQALATIHGHECENCRLHISHVTGCNRTRGTKTCIALPAAILPPVTRYNQLWNTQLLAISLPPLSCLPKESMSLCCAVQKRPTRRSHSTGKRNENAIAAAHRGMRTTFECAASTARQTSHFTHAVRQVRELPTCLNYWFLPFGNEGGGLSIFFWLVKKNRLCFKTGMKEFEERGCESDEHTIGDAMLDHAGTRC